MDVELRELVRRRASDRCEYCRLPQFVLESTFHVEHVIARQHGGSDDDTNLALACDRCNFHKGPNLSSIDPESGAIVGLFHPCADSWKEHFPIQDAHIIGLTPIGRATVQLLQMNAPRRLELRRAVIAASEI